MNRYKNLFARIEMMSKRTVFLLLLCIIAFPLPGFASEKDQNKNVTISIGLLGIDEDSRSRYSEYKDIEDFQLTLSEFSLVNFGDDNTFRYILNMENPGYEDMDLGLYMQHRDNFIFSTAFEKTPHFIEAGISTQRDRYDTRLAIHPLSKVSAVLSYYWEEKDGSISSTQTVDQNNDEIALEVSGGSSGLSGALSLTDSRMEHPYAGYESVGLGFSAAGDINDIFFQSLLLDRKEFSSNRSAFLKSDLELTRAVYNARYEMRDYFHVNLSMSSAETDNSNTGKLRFEKNTYRLGFVLKTSYFRLGYNFRNSQTDYVNAETENKASDSHEVFFKGDLGQAVKVRASYTTEDRNSFGVNTLTLTNFEQLASKNNIGKLNLILTPVEKLTFTVDYLAKEQKYEKVAPTGLNNQNFHSRILAYYYQYSPKLNLYGNHYYTRSLFSGAFEQATGTGSLYPVYRISQDNSTYTLGLTLELGTKSDIDFSYSQGRSKIGDYLRTNSISERNVIISYTISLKKDTDVSLTVGRNNYSDRLSSSVSGKSDLMQLSFSKKTDF